MARVLKHCKGCDESYDTLTNDLCPRCGVLADHAAQAREEVEQKKAREMARDILNELTPGEIKNLDKNLAESGLPQHLQDIIRVRLMGEQQKFQELLGLHRQHMLEQRRHLETRGLGQQTMPTHIRERKLTDILEGVFGGGL